MGLRLLAFGIMVGLVGGCRKPLNEQKDISIVMCGRVIQGWQVAHMLGESVIIFRSEDCAGLIALQGFRKEETAVALVKFGAARPNGVDGMLVFIGCNGGRLQIIQEEGLRMRGRWGKVILNYHEGSRTVQMGLERSSDVMDLYWWDGRRVRFRIYAGP